jgi:hypothetical protein
MFEVAQRLAASGHEVTLLLPDGRRLPDTRFKAEYYSGTHSPSLTRFSPSPRSSYRGTMPL